MSYNLKYYYDDQLHQLRPKATAINTFKMSDGTLIAMFQGSRGTCPKLDFRVKILKEGEEQMPQLPPHLYWVVDLMIKIQQYPDEVKDIIEYYIKFYDTCTPFANVTEREEYKPTTVEHIYKKYQHVQCQNTLPIDYTAYILELFSLCEKQNVGAKMFKGMLLAFKDYIDRKIDYMYVLRAITMPRF